MLPKPANYAVWPSVVLADAPSEMIIAPTERAFCLFEDQEYELTLIACHADEISYYEPTTHKKLTAVAHGGVLRFTWTFEGEQEHLILLSLGEKKLQEFSVYSLRSDLYALTPLRGDFHGHSYRSDGKRDPAALAGHYREQGYDFFSLTDHNRFYPGAEIDVVFHGVHTGITRVPGEEIHAPGSVVHIVHVGGSSSVADQYVHNAEEYAQAASEYEKTVPAHIPAAYRERYAKAMWAVDRIHGAGGLAIFPHPFWHPGKSRVTNVTEEFARMLLTGGLFDAYELVGGMGQANNNRSVALWGELRAEGLKLPVVGSSDVHSIENETTFPWLFTLCFARSTHCEDIIASVREGNCVAVEMTGDERKRQYRCYGSLRLVTYAQYLLKHYFPRRQRICQGEGVAMRAYAMGEADTSLVELLAQQSEAFRDRFFGRKPPVLPTPEMLEFEERSRAVHLSGPTGRGSLVHPETPTRQL